MSSGTPERNKLGNDILQNEKHANSINTNDFPKLKRVALEIGPILKLKVIEEN